MKDKWFYQRIEKSEVYAILNVRGKRLGRAHGLETAAMMAAAPEMYEVLMDILKNYECGPKVDAMIIDAVARAEGRIK